MQENSGPQPAEQGPAVPRMDAPRGGKPQTEFAFTRSAVVLDQVSRRYGSPWPAAHLQTEALELRWWAIL